MSQIKKILSIRNFSLFFLVMQFLHFPFFSLFPGVKTVFSFYPFIMLAWSAFIVLYDFFTTRSLWKNSGIIFLVLFLCSYLITVFSNIRYEFVNNLQLIFWMGLQYIVLYSSDRVAEENNEPPVARTALKFFFTANFVMCLCSLVLFIFNIGLNIGIVVITRIGFRSGRLFGIYASPNAGSVFCVISMIAAVSFLRDTKNVFAKIYYVLAMAVLYLYIVLSLSSSGKISLFLATFLVAFGLFYSALGKQKAVVQWLTAIVLAALIAVSFIFPFKWVQNKACDLVMSLSQKPQVIMMKDSLQKKLTSLIMYANEKEMESISLSETTPEADPSETELNTTATFATESAGAVTEEPVSSAVTEPAAAETEPMPTESPVVTELDPTINIIAENPIVLDRNDVNRYGDSFIQRFTHGRFQIWSECIQYLLPIHPLFGVGPIGYIDQMQELYPETYTAKQNMYSMHNDLVTLLVTTGLVGTLFMGAFMIFCICTICKYLILNRKNIAALKRIWCPLVIVIVTAVTMVFSDAILVNLSTQGVVFWTCLGYVMYTVQPHEGKMYSFINGIFRKLKGGKKDGIQK